MAQACRQAAPDRRPRLALTVIGDQAVEFGSGVERVLDIGLLERASGDPSTQGPGRVVERRVATAWRHAGEVVQDGRYVRLAVAPNFLARMLAQVLRRLTRHCALRGRQLG